MTVSKTIAKNSFYLMFARVAGMILGFFYVMYAAKYLGTEKYGLLAFALSFTTILGIFLNLGFGILTTRDVSRNKYIADKYIGNFVIIKLILAIIVFGIVAEIINIANYSEQKSLVIYLIFLSVICTSYSNLFQSIFQAFQKMEYISISQILYNCLMFVGALFIISFNFGIIGFAYLYLIVNFIILVYNFLFCRFRFINPTYKVDFKFTKNIIKEALPFCFTSIISVLFYHVDILMLSEIKGSSVTGLYNSACVIIISITSIAEVFVYAIFPVASDYFTSSQSSLEKLCEKTTKYLSLAAFPSSIGIILLAPKIISLIYGDEFLEATIVLQILGLYLPLRFISYSTGWTLASINREPLRTLSAGLAIFVNIILNYILIPKYGIVGASVATLISQLILFSLFFHFVAKYFYKIPMLKITIKPLMCSVIMGIFILWFDQHNLFITIIISSLIYIISLYMMQGFDLEDKKVFHEIMSILPR